MLDLGCPRPGPLCAPVTPSREAALVQTHMGVPSHHADAHQLLRIKMYRATMSTGLRVRSIGPKAAWGLKSRARAGDEHEMVRSGAVRRLQGGTAERS